MLSTVTLTPLSLYDVPVGTYKTLSFDLTTDPNAVKKARLTLNAEDFDEPDYCRRHIHRPDRRPGPALVSVAKRVHLSLSEPPS